MVKVKNCRVIPSGANAVRNSSGVVSKIQSMAESIADAASAKTPTLGKTRNSNYFVTVRHGRQRAFANVVTGNYASKKDNAKNNTLLKSIDAGRG